MNEIMIKLQGKCQEKYRESKDHIKSWGVAVVLSVRAKTFKKILFKKKSVSKLSAVNSNLIFLNAGTSKWGMY